MALTAQGLHINTTNNQDLQKAVGQNVKLDCRFTTAPEDAGPLEIEWSVKSRRNPMEKKTILLYTAGHTYDNYYEPQKGRVYFHKDNPGKGDASINLLLLTPSDTGIYYCQVKKVPGIQSIKTVLQVLKPPSKPRCYHTEEAGKVGKIQVLKCGSEEGAVPTWYSWTREPPGKLLSISAVMDQTAGTLTIKDPSYSDTGTYKCTAWNRVGGEDCFLEFNLPYPPSVEMIAGAVVGCLAAIGIIASVTFCIIRHLRKSEPEPSNEIVEDASPPRRRRLRRPNCGTLDSSKIVVISPQTPM